jgi:CxxC motif-containing protein (DUF1111 family)
LSWRARACVLAAAACACLGRHDAAPSTDRSGASSTVFDATHDAFSQAVTWLTPEHRRAFFVGNSLFNSNWVSAPASVAQRDGLGPLFNARSCSACHFKDGRGRPPEAGAPLASMIVRVSVRGQRGPDGAPVDHAAYGGQIQGGAVPEAAAEADVFVDYEDVNGTFEDGEAYVLKKPRYRLEHAGYGALPADLALSPRVAPALVGLGPLEGVPEALLEKLADPEDSDGNGVSGRLNRVPDVRKKALVAGRFGWKAEQPNVLQQAAAALASDMGLTTSLFPGPTYAAEQKALAALPDGGSPEVEERALHALALYARALAVPARRNHTDPKVVRGEALFASAGCAACHVPALETRAFAELPELAAETIHPYTDLLLHDLGPELSDDRPSFQADGSEWRTPPLWGIGLVHKVNGHTRFLHDGRARDLTEAILWHGGEGANARSAFVKLPRAERHALLAFVGSL